MPQQSVFRWRDGRGWLVLANGPSSEIRGMALTRSAADGAVACVAIEGVAAADALLEDLEDLGAPSGFIVDLQSEDDDTIRDQLANAGLVVVTAGVGPNDVRSALMGAAIEGIGTAYAQGAVVLLEGGAACAVGDHLYDSAAQGLGWFAHALLMPDARIEGVEAAARELLASAPDAYALMIGAESAAVFGGDGQVEMWGERRVTLLLGAQYRGTGA